MLVSNLVPRVFGFSKMATTRSKYSRHRGKPCKDPGNKLPSFLGVEKKGTRPLGIRLLFINGALSRYLRNTLKSYNVPSHQWRPKNDALNFRPKDYAAIPSLSCFGTYNVWVSCGISVAAEGLFQAVFWGGRVSILQLSQNWSIFLMYYG